MSAPSDFDPIDVACRLADALERQGLPYAIGGALAYGYWGVPRGTLDVDVNIFVTSDDVDAVLDALGSMGCEIDAEDSRRRAAERGDLEAWLGEVRIDVFLSSIPAHQLARERIERVTLGDRKRTPILSAEDIVFFKLLFWRSKDKPDIESILAARLDGFDIEYVKRGLSDALPEDDLRIAWLDEVYHQIVRGASL